MPANDVASVLRFINKSTADQLADKTSVRLSQLVPREIFAAHWRAPEACRNFTRREREALLQLTASAGDEANMEVALAAADLVAYKIPPTLGSGSLDAALTAAATSGDLGCCQLLAGYFDPPVSDVAKVVLTAAAARGDMAMCRWARDVCPELQQNTGTVSSAAAAGNKAACEAFLQLLPNPGAAAAEAVLKAAASGRVDTLDWLLSRCPVPGRDPKDGPTTPPNPQRLLEAAAEGCDLRTLQRLWAQQGAPGRLPLWAWGDVLEILMACRTPDWAAKADWVLQHGVSVEVRHCYTVAARYPDAAARLDWLRSNGLPPDLSPASAAASSALASRSRPATLGHACAVEWLLAAGMRADAGDTALQAAAAGSLPVLQAMRGAGCPLDRRPLAHSAACVGCTPVLGWVRDAFGIGMADLTVHGRGLQDSAAASGSVEVMDWLRAEGCVAGMDAWGQAAKSGCGAALELLHEWQVPKPTIGAPYRLAAERGDLRTLRVLRRLGVSSGPRTGPLTFILNAALTDPLAALQWLVDAGCPVDWAAAEDVAAREGELGWLLPWVQEQRRRWRRFRFQRVPEHGGGAWTAGGGGQGKRGRGRLQLRD